MNGQPSRESETKDDADVQRANRKDLKRSLLSLFTERTRPLLELLTDIMCAKPELNQSLDRFNSAEASLNEAEYPSATARNRTNFLCEQAAITARVEKKYQEVSEALKETEKVLDQFVETLQAKPSKE